MPDIQNQIKSVLKENGLTVRQAVEVLKECNAQILREMPIQENLDSVITW